MNIKKTTKESEIIDGSATLSKNSENQKKGMFIVFEGLDHSGKTTQCKMLVNYMNINHHLYGKAIYATCPTRTTPIGQLINKYLKKEIEIDDHAIHMLFAANRHEIKKIIIDNINSGINVIMDRYSYSGIAYSLSKNIEGINMSWCKAQEIGLPEPDKIIFIDIDLEIKKERNDYGEERYENIETQKNVLENYEKLFTDIWTIVNGMDNKEQVHIKVLDSICCAND